MHTKDQGSLIELRIAADLISRGYTVAFPYGENHSYDLIAEKEKRFIRIQCKSPASNSTKDKIRIRCRVCNHTKTHKYKEDDFDFMATCQNGCFYYVPSSLTSNKSSIWIKRSSFMVL